MIDVINIRHKLRYFGWVLGDTCQMRCNQKDLPPFPALRKTRLPSQAGVTGGHVTCTHAQ